MPGRYYDQWTIGDRIRHQPHRTVTEADNLLISALTHNPQPLHLDAEFSKSTEFGKQLVNSLWTLGFMIGVSVGDTTLGTTVGNLGMTDVRFPKPVFHGDTLRATTTILEKRESKSRPNNGIVTFEHRCFNQRGEEVAYCKRQGMMLKRSAAKGQEQRA
jgi:acyl dehydratase